MLQITYSKGIYTLADNTKTYTFNINNGQLINTKTNKIVSRPAFKKQDMLNTLSKSHNYWGYKNMLDVLYSCLGHNTIDNTFCDDTKYLSQLLAMDKLFNVLPNGCALTNVYVEDYDLSKLSTKQLGIVIKYIREYNDNDTNISISRLLNRLEMEELAIACGNLPIAFVEKYAHSLKTLYSLGNEYRDIAFYYYYTQKLYKLRNGTNSNYSSYSGRDYILTYIKCCKVMNKAPIKTNNFMREYLETLNAYDLWCETDEQERFSSIYNRYKDNLLFEYGDYQVSLPQLTQDLIIEGNEMHHCVGGYIDKVANGETLIVFIRHKNTPNKCYITAQINPQNGQLEQYYLAYDHPIQKTEDKEFKQKYQEWLLNKQW